jgi:hypothetical protein
VTLLNYDFYNEQMKPVIAEWAYLWLQKHHLHGIDRLEAVQYMLEGAAARSDTSTKVCACSYSVLLLLVFKSILLMKNFNSLLDGLFLS